jgi:hypothetical protein
VAGTVAGDAALGVGPVSCGERDEVKQGGLGWRREGSRGAGGCRCRRLREVRADGGEGRGAGCRQGHGAVVGSAAAAAGGELDVGRLT